MGDRCPFCEAAKGKYTLENQWLCQTFWIPSAMSYMRSLCCRDRQIANLQDRLEAWRDYREYYGQPEKWEDVLKRLKSLGEI